MSRSEARDHWRAALYAVLHRLCSSADDQLRYLRGLGVGDSIDELGLEYDDVWMVFVGLLDEAEGELQTRLQDLDRALSSDDLIWEAGALRDSLAWRRIRDLARHALEALGASTDS